MAKLRLAVWIVALGAAAVALLDGVRWPAPADPAVATMAVVRVVAGALAVYLLAATVLAIRLPRLAPRFVRRLVGTAFGVALLAAPMTASASASSADDRPPVEAPVLRRVEDPPAPPPPPTDTNVVDFPSAADGSATNLVTVEPGDHLWRVAEREVERRLGRPATDAEVGPYWLRLVEENRATLASGDPDLVFPGETVRLPS